MTERRLSTVAEGLSRTYDTHEPVAPPRTVIDGIDLAGAYRIQQFQGEEPIAAGRRVAGRTIEAPLDRLAGLCAGDIVPAGSFCAAAPVSAGQRVDVDYDVHGHVSVRFS